MNRYRYFTILYSTLILLAIFFRTYNLTSVPPALHGDELGVGYNAYTLLKTGRDEYGRFLPLTFRSDFTPLIFYATVPFIALLGLTEFATRFSTALVGILTVPALYFLVLELTQRIKLALLAMFLISLSSWHIRTSRIALELTWGLFFQIVAITLFLHSLKSGRKSLIFSFFVFGISIFSYHSTKMTTPLIIMALIYIYRKEIRPILNLKQLFLFFSIFITFPILLYFYVQSFSQIRFVGISVFTLWKNSYPYSTSLLSFKPLSDLIFMIIKNYLIHFDPRLLFLDNQGLRYFQLSHLGLFYLWQAPFVIFGFIQVLRNWQTKSAKLLIFLFFLAPLPASLTTGVPFSNIGRIILFLPVMEILSACGIIALGKNIGVRFIAIAIASISLGFFIYQYFSVLPISTAAFWGTQWRQAAKIALNKEREVDHIIFTNAPRQSYMYVLFYGQKDPQWLFASTKKRADGIGYISIGKFEFRPVNWDIDKTKPNTLIVGSVKEILSLPAVLEIPSQDSSQYLRVVNTSDL